MSEVKKIATREAYGKALAEFGESYPDMVVLDADLAAATKTDVFKKKFPDRHVDCGIAEANMMGIAAGLSLTGKIPVASTFAMFASGRAFEQVRNSIGYPHLNVKIGATHAGITVGEDGATHQCNEDIALMRTIPGMVVLNPADHYEMVDAVKAAAAYKGPVYLRLGRLAVESCTEDVAEPFALGKGRTLREGDDIAIVATGLMVGEALKAHEALKASGIHARVIDIHTIKPIDRELLIKAAKETGRVVTVEEHSVIGGLGEAVCACLCEECPVPVTRIGVNDVFGHSGPAVDLLKEFGLSAENIEATVKKVLGK